MNVKIGSSSPKVRGEHEKYLSCHQLVKQTNQGHQVSHEKNPYYFPLYWLVNRDPYNGLL